MELEKLMRDQCLLVRVRGELDHHWSDLLRQGIDRELIERGAKHLLLNLEGLTFMDSSGIGVLLGRYKRITQQGGQMALCRVSSAVEKVLRISGVPKIITSYQSEAEALSRLGLAAKRRPK
ncbi:MAG: anti-sigma F factor antagonist [Dethiobacter sp.]|jgi:stage II sporulation protein AA (anti-sigma F factor antagonist)|nr:anti-sigma F factor antagonist [Dethiobacter sp.]